LTGVVDEQIHMRANTTDLDGQLFALSRAYARAADRRDPVEFVSAFAADGRLSICSIADPDVIRHTRRGHDELAAIPVALGRYARTFHFLGQASYEIGAGAGASVATGEVYCIAHHLTVAAESAQNKVMYIRYGDEYGVDATGAWRIAHRRVQVDWTEMRPADQPVAEK
jgi:hypothetical protein